MFAFLKIRTHKKAEHERVRPRVKCGNLIRDPLNDVNGL